MSYRKLKNILGVSLMTLAIVLSQVPMGDTLAAKKENAKAVEQQQENVEKNCTVTFNMNGGVFKGRYNDYEFNNKMPVILLEAGEKIKSFPDENFINFAGYKTEKDTWYTDKECTVKFDKNGKITSSVTLYKKWYSITADGKKKAQKGFYLNPEGTVLYKYDGNDSNVVIPETVNIIADDAFGDLDGIRGITLPKDIDVVSDEAFGVEKINNNIIYLYDSKSLQSRMMARELEKKYDQFVYSQYLDAEDVQAIAGVDYGFELSENAIEINAGDAEKEETTKVEETSETEEKSEKSAETEEESKAKESDEVVVIEPGSEEKTATEEKETTEEKSSSEEKETTEEKSSSEEKETTEEKSSSEEKETTEEKPSTEEKSLTEESSTEESTTKEETYLVVFHLNGGGFTGIYQNEKYDNASSLKMSISKEKDFDASIYPKSDDSSKFVYDNYKTDDKWYTDKNCLNEFVISSYTQSKDKRDDVTLYKKWYHTVSSDGTTEADTGFITNPTGTVLYKYNGNYSDITIPASVTSIGKDAFIDLQNVKSIKLPASLTEVDIHAFSGITNVSGDIAIYGESEVSKKIADDLINKYQHFVVKTETKTEQTAEKTEENKKEETKDTEKKKEETKKEDINKETTKKDSAEKEKQKETKDDNTNENISVVDNGTIKLGARTISGAVAVKDAVDTIVSEQKGANTNPISTVALADSVAKAEIQSENKLTTISENKAALASGVDNGGASQLAYSNGTARSTQHIKDSTPKTGDNVNYKIIFVFIMFSGGALLLLTGNSKKKIIF